MPARKRRRNDSDTSGMDDVVAADDKMSITEAAKKTE